MLTMHLCGIINHGYINTLLFMHSLGDVDLRVKITAFQFQSSPSQEASLVIDGNTPLETILDVVSGDIIFAGCGQCSAELETDENSIYRPCYPCLPHTGVRRYYRSVSTKVCVCVCVCMYILKR